jgi:hypothetical protein
MTCPAGTSNVSVAASNNGLGYSDPVDLQIVVTDYALDVTPAVTALAAGESSRHVVTVTPQGGAFNSEVTLTCATANLPPQTTCTFDPPTVVPGPAGARSTLTLATVSSSGTAVVARAPPPPPTIGTRAAGSGIALFPAALIFATQTISTTAPPQFVNVTNTGTGVLALSSITVAGDFAAANNCGTSLAIGASCAVAVSFTPTVIGPRAGTLSFGDDAPGTPQAVALAGTGQAAPSSTGGTPSGTYSVSFSGTAGTLSHFGSVTLTVQ